MNSKGGNSLKKGLHNSQGYNTIQIWPRNIGKLLDKLLSAVGSQKLQVVSEPFSTSCKNTTVLEMFTDMLMNALYVLTCSHHLLGS